VLQKLNLSIQKIFSSTLDEKLDFSKVEDNPLVEYVRIFQNQHRLISIFYRGLIFSFGSFFLLISFFIFNAYDNIFIPRTGLFVSLLIDLLLLYFVLKTIKQFKKYRKKSEATFAEIYDYLKKDLKQLERIKTGYNTAQGKNRLVGLSSVGLVGKKRPKQVENYSGWDQQTCPRCGLQIEMLEKKCPNCLSLLNNNYPF